MASSAFPNRPFQLREYVSLVQQDTATNRSLLAWQVWIDKLSYSPTSSGGKADRQFFLAGIKVGEILTSGFDFRGSGPWLILEGQNWIDHLPDGTQSIPVKAVGSYDILGYTEINYTLNLPTIPRASTATFVGGAAFDAGAAVTINTNRASSSFTHDITFQFGSISGTVGTGVGASVAWTPPLSLLQQIPNAASGTGTLTVVTKNGTAVVGTKTTQFTLRAGAAVVPTISSLTVSDDNPTVASQVGLFVQGLSLLKATVNAAGVQGSTITSRSFKMGQVSADSGGVIPITASGSVAVTASATDSRSRVGSWAGTVTVLPYAQPLFTNVLVRRCDAGGTLNDSGTSLRIDLSCAVQSLINGTQRNALTIRVFTRPYGATTWTARNTVTPTGVTYNSNFVVSGGANYPIDDSFDVRVEISDKFKSAAAQTVVATAAVFMHWSKVGVGIGKFHEFGALDVAGDVYANGVLLVPASRTATATQTGIAELATQAEAKAGDTTRIITGQTMIGAVDPAWVALTLASGWAAATDTRPAYHRATVNTKQLTSAQLVRTGSGLAVSAGTWYTVGTLPAASRPDAIVSGAGVIGIAGNLGPCGWRVLPTGEVQFTPYMAGGTIATSGGVQNSVILPSLHMA